MVSLVSVLMSGIPQRRRWLTRAERSLPPLERDSDMRLRRGHAAVDFRESYANVWRRLERGETPVTCSTCGCETDVAVPCHEPRCEESQ